MVDHLSVIMVAVVIAMILMISASKPLTSFVDARPTVVILCLSFLLMIGFSLVAEAFGFHVPKGYLYAAIGFSIMIEVFNRTMRRNRRRSLFSSARTLRDRTAMAVLNLPGGTASDDEKDTAHTTTTTTVGGAAMFGKDELAMVQGVLDLAHRPVRSIMTPRPEITSIDPRESAEQLRAEVTSSSHAWMPVAGDDLDQLVGVASSRDLLASLLEHGHIDVRQRRAQTAHGAGVAQRIAPHRRVPPLAAASGLGGDRVRQRAWALTPTDVLEVIAGEFPDDESGDRSFVQESDGSWMLDASLDLRRVEHMLGFKLSGDDSFSTLAGYVLQQLGRLPSVGDSFTSEGLHFEVMAMDGARIERLKVRPVGE